MIRHVTSRSGISSLWWALGICCCDSFKFLAFVASFIWVNQCSFWWLVLIVLVVAKL